MTTPDQEPARHRADGPTIESLPVTTESRKIRDLWKAGLSQWGHAFVAYAQLRTPQLHTEDVLTDFENVYVATLPSYDALIDDHLEGMGWRQPLAELRETYFIPEHLLDFNRPAVLAAFKEFMDVVEAGGEVHVFHL